MSSDIPQWQRQVSDDLEHKQVPENERLFSRRGVFIIGGSFAFGVAGAFAGVRIERSTAPRPTFSDEVGVAIMLDLDSTNAQTNWNLPEVMRISRRLDRLSSFLRETLIHPNIGVNTSNVWDLSEGEIEKLMVASNPRGRVARWDFGDQENQIYIVRVTHTYEDDQGLSQRTLALGVNRSRTAPIQRYLDENGFIRKESLDAAADKLVRPPDYLSATGPYSVRRGDQVYEGRRSIGIDPETGAQGEYTVNSLGQVDLRITENFYTTPVDNT